MSNDRFKTIPAGACMLVVGEPEIGDNGDGAKSAPVRLVARSGKPIEHWFWGRVVHDLAGMRLHKSRIPIDYVHDSKEVIGYLNRFDTESGDLITSGALVPFKESDRATEILHKFRAGVPYEASINFGGDGIKVEELSPGQVSQVNGYQFEGPGVIVREWPLRGVAICPYGADANTESAALAGANAKTYMASVVIAEPNADTEETAMSEQTVEVSAPVSPEVEEAKSDELNAEESALEQTVEAQADEAQVEAPQEAVEASAVEAEPAAEVVEEPAEEVKKELSREEFARINAEFGAEIAAQVMCDGGDYVAALKLAYEATRTERDQLRVQLAEATKSEHGTPVKVVAVPADPKKGKLFNTGK